MTMPNIPEAPDHDAQAGRLDEIAGELRTLLEEAREICRDSRITYMANADAYVFEQIAEHIQNGNPYNQSLASLAEEIRAGEPQFDEGC